MSSVKVPNDYFAKSKKEYSDWFWAFVRELIQNCVDARATQIEFSVETDVDGSIVFNCTDNGIGMDENVLVNALLCLGGSYKEEGSVGKFGYAKVLLYFAHKEYRIHTRNYVVRGAGGDYEVKTSPETLSGTSSTIVMEPEKSASDWVATIKEYVRYMNVPTVEISVSLQHGQPEVVPQFKTAFKNNDFKYGVSSALGPLSFNDEAIGNYNVLVVAERGLPMFVYRTYTFGGTCVMGMLQLETDGVEKLTSNRDGLTYTYQDKLNGIISTISENRSKLKMGKTFEVVLNETQPLEVSVPTGEEQRGSGVTSSKVSMIRKLVNASYPQNFCVRIQDVVGGKSRTNETSLAKILDNMKLRWVQDLAFQWKAIVRSFLRTEKAFKMGVSYYANDGRMIIHPWEDWDLTQDGEYYVGGKRITTGFVISDDLEGQCVTSGTGICILVNPLRFKGANVLDLIDVAAHECAHIAVNAHNEEFVRKDIDLRRDWRKTASVRDIKALAEQTV